MISLDELISKARLKSMSLGNAEKDYLIDLTLFSISKNTKDELVFKGGTCLSKFYNLDRFSEDIDCDDNDNKVYKDALEICGNNKRESRFSSDSRRNKMLK